MKKILSLLSVLSMIIVGSITQVNAIELKSQENSKNDIIPTAFEQIAKSKRYSDIVTVNGISGGTYRLQYMIKVVYSLSFNSNTYQVSSVTEPRIVIEMAELSTDYGGSHVYLDNLSVDAVIASNKLSAYFEWKFNIKANIGGEIYYFGNITDSATIKV